MDGFRSIISEVVELLQEIRDELKELRLLYKSLVDRVVPEEEPLEDEKEAIESSDELVGENEVLRIFGARALHDGDIYLFCISVRSLKEPGKLLVLSVKLSLSV
uniref:Uncharacterized protein n=1 Tax=Thermofilum adornatum TaxID=1365176 RepID=A0A7C1CFJ4_9CREN